MDAWDPWVEGRSVDAWDNAWDPWAEAGRSVDAKDMSEGAGARDECLEAGW